MNGGWVDLASVALTSGTMGSADSGCKTDALLKIIFKILQFSVVGVKFAASDLSS